MVLLWHIPAILIFYILCIDRGVDAVPRKHRILAPSLWLCKCNSITIEEKKTEKLNLGIWMLLIVNVFTYYSELRKFKKHPQFLRTNVVLVKKMTEFSKLKAMQPGKMLVSVDSDV